VTELEELDLLDRKARELATAAQSLRRYETAVEQAGGAPNPEIYGSLKHDVWEAEVSLNALIRAQEDARLASLTADEIQQVRLDAQEKAIAAVAEAQGWAWEEDRQRWRTPQATYYSRIGEPLSDG
jgi:hypothetical protein